MSNVPWMLLRLGLETAAHHMQADEDRLSLLDVKTTADYRAALGRIFGFEVAVEAAVWRMPGIDAATLRGRARAALLRDDLESLGLTKAQMERIPTAPVSIRSVAQALGWLFVVERHTLLAGVIQRQLQHVLGANDAFRYLSASGTTPGARFRALGDELGRYANVHEPGRVVAAAGDAFRAQRLWYLGGEAATARTASLPVATSDAPEASANTPVIPANAAI